MIYLQVYSRVSLPRRETEALDWILYERVREIWQQEGECPIDLDQPSKPVELPSSLAVDPWRFELPKPPTAVPNGFKVFPAHLGAATFSCCVLLSMWFYNFFLKVGGFTWSQWMLVTTKLIIPRFNDGWQDSFQDSFDKDNPVQPHHRSRSAPAQPPSLKRSMLMVTFAMLNSVLGNSQGFQLRSESTFRNRLRKYRGYNGQLETTNLSGGDLFALQQRVKASQEMFSAAIDGSKDAHSAVVDTGCSCSATNDPNDAIPGTLRKLDEPIELGGIAGGLKIEWMAKANWETLDNNGKVQPIQLDVLIHESLPSRLLSPQAFLKHSSQNVDDHFRVYADHSEWHQDGRNILTLNYDNSFLPRIVLFNQGKALPTLEALTSVLHNSNANLSVMQKVWMRWHIKLGHLSFKHVQKLGLGGFLDKFALGLNRSKISEQPQCASC